MKLNNSYYLSSLESEIFGKTRECRLVKKFKLKSGKILAVVKVDPVVIGQPFGFIDDVDLLVLTHRHLNKGLFPIKEFPCFVHICIPKSLDVLEQEVISSEDLIHTAWGELYRTKKDADQHRFE